jgi:hypothetical protein
MSLSHDSEQLLKQWLSNLRSRASESLLDDPRYYLCRPQSLIASSQPQRLLLGTGEQICANIFDAFRTVEHEILFVTCFWAHSASQAAFASALKALSARAIASDRRIRVRIGFSSCSLWQKLTQTSSLSGKEWPASTWPSKFGLPSAAELLGLDITIRSIFVWPLSVMHSKFVICDRERMFLPSCNVSWEAWFEGCIELRGDVVAQAVLFWGDFWGRDETLPPLESNAPPRAEDEALSEGLLLLDPEQGVVEHTARDPCLQIPLAQLGTIPTILLPSPHHRNPHFRPFPFFTNAVPPPPTPLNIFLLTILSYAKRSVYIQSPNMTSQPVLDAILSALKRGVNVQVVSNRRMQAAEQLLTAGRLTEWALRDLYLEYTKSLKRFLDDSNRGRDLEAGASEHGGLKISYYRPAASGQHSGGSVPAFKSHLKLTIVDKEIVVLGSGNMDRASWYTSQELGMAFSSRELAAEVMRGVREGLESCVENAMEPY